MKQLENNKTRLTIQLEKNRPRDIGEIRETPKIQE